MDSKNYVDPALRVPLKNRKRFRRDQAQDVQSTLCLDWIKLHRLEGLSVGLWLADSKSVGYRKKNFPTQSEIKQPNIKRKPKVETVYRLPLVRLESLPKMIWSEASEMARIIYGELIVTGCLQSFPGIEALWIEVIASIAVQPPEMITPSEKTGFQTLQFGGFDSAWRYLLTGFSSNKTKSFSGWREKIGKDPTYCLRESFLISMRRGWGIREAYRWENHRHWQPRRAL